MCSCIDKIEADFTNQFIESLEGGANHRATVKGFYVRVSFTAEVTSESGTPIRVKSQRNIRMNMCPFCRKKIKQPGGKK